MVYIGPVLNAHACPLKYVLPARPLYIHVIKIRNGILLRIYTFNFLFLCSFKERGARNTLELLSPVRNILSILCTRDWLIRRNYRELLPPPPPPPPSRNRGSGE